MVQLLVKFQRHLVESAAVACTTTAVYSFFELFIIGIPSGVSGRARLVVIGLIFAGIGSVFARCRDASLRLTQRLHHKQLRRVAVHDMVFLVTFNLIIAPLLYATSGATLAQTIAGTTLAALLALFTGPLNGLALDNFRAWAGLKHQEGSHEKRPPQMILIYLIIALTVVFVVGIFAVADTIQSPNL
jgi:uncharacterized membrane protein YidH (DUF202 family)